MKTVWRTLIQQPRFAGLFFAIFLSTIGSGVSQAVVLAEFSKAHASGFIFGLLFLFGLAPGFIASRFAVNFSTGTAIKKALILAQIIGAFSLIVSSLGLVIGYPISLLLTEVVSSVVWGFTVSFTPLIITSAIKNEELTEFSRFENSLFSSQSLVAFGIAALLWPLIGSYPLLALDLVSYLIAVFCFSKFLANDFSSETDNPEQSSSIENTRWSYWSPIQKKHVLIMPLLALAATPAMTLLPLLGQKWGTLTHISFLVVSPALFLSIGKSMGQIIGPWLPSNRILDRIVRERVWLMAMVIAFVGLYILSCRTENIIVAVLLVTLAHVISNILFTASYLGTRNHFSGQALVAASSLQYQGQLAVMSVSALIAGALATQQTDIIPVLAGGGILAVMIFTLYEWRSAQ